MFSFKSFRRKCFIRLMTVLGFGGMVGFCIASCQSPKSNQNQQPKQESPENIGSVQAETQLETQADNPSPTNPDTQDVQETIDNQTETMIFEQVDDEQQIPDPIPINTKKTDEDDNTDFITPMKAYGIRPPKLRVPPTKPGGASRDEVRQSMIELTKKIQSTCHPEAGTLKVSFTILNCGKIVNVKSIDGTLKGAKSEKCILRHISKYQYREFEGSNIPVVYPFKFK